SFDIRQGCEHTMHQRHHSLSFRGCDYKRWGNAKYLLRQRPEQMNAFTARGSRRLADIAVTNASIGQISFRCSVPILRLNSPNQSPKLAANVGYEWQFLEPKKALLDNRR